LATTISGIPMPEIASYRGSWSERSCPRPKGRYGVTLSVGELDIQPSNWETEIYYLAIVTPAKSSSPLPRCQVMLWCAVGELLRNQRLEIKS